MSEEGEFGFLENKVREVISGRGNLLKRAKSPRGSSTR